MVSEPKAETGVSVVAEAKVEIGDSLLTDDKWRQAEDYLREKDPLLIPFIDKYSPCKLKEGQDYFDNLCESIICQQISTKAAESIMVRFRNLFQTGVATAVELLALRDEALRTAGLSPQKVKYVRDLAEKVSTGLVKLDQVKELTNSEIEKQLLLVKGIGPWTVTMFLIFALNRTDILPTGDLGIRKAMQNIYNLPDLPDSETMREIAAPWHPYESVASWYLWRSLENKAT